MVPVDGGQPVALALDEDFSLYNTPLWAPGGNEIIFYGVSRTEPNKPGSWWMAPLNGGRPRSVRLPGAEGDELYASVRAWTRTKDGHEWIVYSVSNDDAWKLLRIEISVNGEVSGRPEQLNSGTGELDFGGSFSADGSLTYTIVTSGSSIYEIPINDRGQKLGPTQQLLLSGEGDDRSPSVSRDGRWMVYSATRPGKPNVVLLRDLSGVADRFLADNRDRRPGYGVTSISPDGSKIIFARDCKSDGFPPQPVRTCSFVVSAAGGQSEQVCEFCTPRGFASNGSVVLFQKYDPLGRRPDRIVALDLSTRTEKDFLLDLSTRKEKDFPGLSENDLYHAFFSWDDHWVVFKRLLGLTKAQILIAPVRDGEAGKEAEWISVTDGRYSDDKPQFSPDGDTVYFTSTRDGYLCIWAQRLDPATKHPAGAPVAYEHFHNSMGHDPAMERDPESLPYYQFKSDLSVARDKILINLLQIRTTIWMVQVE